LGFFALLALGACSQSGTPVSLFAGFDYEWEFLSHRISYLRAEVGPVEEDGGIEVGAGIIGGPFSLNPAAPEGVRYGLSWARLTSSKVWAQYGSMDLQIGPTGRADSSIELDRSALPPADSYVVVLQGLVLDTDVPQSTSFPDNYDPIDGWTPQVLGAGVTLSGSSALDSSSGGELLLDGAGEGSLVVHGWLQFKAGPLDRENMNDALELATIGGQLHYAVLGVDDGELTVGTLEADAYYAISGSPYTEIGPLGADQRTLALQGQPGLSLGLPLLHSFRLELNRDLGEEGRYLRAMAVALESFEYNAETGAADVLLDTYCSHSSLIEEGDLQVEFEVQVGLLQVNDAAAEYESDVLEGEQGAGPFDLQVLP